MKRMTISVFPPHPDNGFREYQAQVGDVWVRGTSLGGAIANAVDTLEAHGGKISALNVVVQELGGDEFFSDADRTRRNTLTQKQQTSGLSASEEQEWERLMDTETEASGKRAHKIAEVSK